MPSVAGGGLGTLTAPLTALVSAEPAPAAALRAREVAWRHAHRATLQKFAGEWVIVEGNELITHGSDPARLVAEARAMGIRVPYIFFVDTDDSQNVKLGL